MFYEMYFAIIENSYSAWIIGKMMIALAEAEKPGIESKLAVGSRLFVLRH